MRNLAPTFCLIGLLAVAGAACIQHEGQLAVLLTGDTGAQNATVQGATQVNVEITEVAVRDSETGAFLTLAAGSQVYELLNLDGRSTVLALADELDEGNYSAIRIRFSQANSSVVNDAGRKNPLLIEPQSITVPTVFSVIEDAQTRVTLALDVSASVAMKANGTWVFRPVIHQQLDDF